VKRLTVAVLVNDRMVPGPKPTSMPRSGAELARIDTLVRNAVGVDSARGDKLSVVNVAFDGAPVVTVDSLPTDVWSRIGQAQKPIVTGGALLAILVVAMLTMRSLKPARPALDPALTLAAGQAPNAALPALAAGSATTEETLAQIAGESQPQILIAGPEPREPIVLREVANPVRDQVVAIIQQRPEAATRVVRNWLKQD
jgi:flagellar M-ring protein FliF